MYSRSKIIGIILFLVATGIFTWAYFTLLPQKDSKLKTSSSPTSSTSTKKGQQLPINVNNPSVKTAWATYIFSGIILITEKVTDGTQLVISIKAPKKPKFIVTKKTTIVMNTNGKTTPGTVDDLKIGKKINITAEYGLKSKKWTTKKVEILLSDTNKSSTPSSTTN